MRNAWCCVLLGLAASMSAGVLADDKPAPRKRTLEHDCQTWATWVEHGFRDSSLKTDALRCVDTITGYREMGAAIGGAWCAPDDLTTAQAIRALLQYVKDHPADDPNEAGGALALRAFTAAYPCGEPPAPGQP